MIAASAITKVATKKTAAMNTKAVAYGIATLVSTRICGQSRTIVLNPAERCGIELRNRLNELLRDWSKRPPGKITLSEIVEGISECKSRLDMLQHDTLKLCNLTDTVATRIKDEVTKPIIEDVADSLDRIVVLLNALIKDIRTSEDKKC